MFHIRHGNVAPTVVDIPIQLPFFRHVNYPHDNGDVTDRVIHQLAIVSAHGICISALAFVNI